ncbi:MAG: hypothetical protein K6F53_12440 [Lachnospiraceae bacterium]|nr:hypothetical protein [Lachnospiraceae bacterium]
MAGLETNILVYNQGRGVSPNFNFMLRVEGIFDLPCRRVHSFTKQNEFEYIQEGGLNDYVHMRRKPISQPFTFQVERYVGVDYIDPLGPGTDLILPIVLMVWRMQMNENFTPFRVYTFTGCTVMSKEYGELNAEQSGLLTETTTIGYREMVRITVPDGLFDGDINKFKLFVDDKSAKNVKTKASSENRHAKTPVNDAQRPKKFLWAGVAKKGDTPKTLRAYSLPLVLGKDAVAAQKYTLLPKVRWPGVKKGEKPKVLRARQIMSSDAVKETPKPLAKVRWSGAAKTDKPPKILRARQIMSSDAVKETPKPLEKVRWSGAAKTDKPPKILRARQIMSSDAVKETPVPLEKVRWSGAVKTDKPPKILRARQIMPSDAAKEAAKPLEKVRWSGAGKTDKPPKILRARQIMPSDAAKGAAKPLEKVRWSGAGKTDKPPRVLRARQIMPSDAAKEAAKPLEKVRWSGAPKGQTPPVPLRARQIMPSDAAKEAPKPLEKVRWSGAAKGQKPPVPLRANKIPGSGATGEMFDKMNVGLFDFKTGEKRFAKTPVNDASRPDQVLWGGAGKGAKPTTKRALLAEYLK